MRRRYPQKALKPSQLRFDKVEGLWWLYTIVHRINVQKLKSIGKNLIWPNYWMYRSFIRCVKINYNYNHDLYIKSASFFNCIVSPKSFFSKRMFFKFIDLLQLSDDQSYLWLSGSYSTSSGKNKFFFKTRQLIPIYGSSILMNSIILDKEEFWKKTYSPLRFLINFDSSQKIDCYFIKIFNVCFLIMSEYYKIAIQTNFIVLN